MTEQDREFLIEVLMMKMVGYSRLYFENMPIKELEKYYLDSLGESPE